MQKILEAEGTDVHRHLGRRDVEALTGAGMAVGFHTLHHEILTRLGDGELEAALTVGPKRTRGVVGRPLPHFAYPHGKADPRTAGKVRDAGYEAAWTGRPSADASPRRPLSAGPMGARSTARRGLPGRRGHQADPRGASMTVPEVSVVVPTRNRCRELELAIRSALGQSGVELEVLIVDDGSTDATESDGVGHLGSIGFGT